MGRSILLIRWSLMTVGHVAAGGGSEALGGEVGVGDGAKKCWGEGGEYVWNSHLRNADSHETGCSCSCVCSGLDYLQSTKSEPFYINGCFVSDINKQTNIRSDHLKR